MSAHAPRRPRRVEHFTVSALFDEPEAVDRALVHLIRAGVPRDLIEVVVSPRAAERFYPEAAPPPRNESFRYAGVGALIGLIAGAFISLVLVALPGFQDPGVTAIVQLIGPNLCTISGAVIGAIVGLLVRRRVARRHARAAEAPDSIVLVVNARTEEEARTLQRILADLGGRDPRLEQ